MVRVLLKPFPGVGAAMIDVVAECLLEASCEIRSFGDEAHIGPVLVERQNLVDLECIHKSTVQAIALRASAYDPILQLCVLSYPWFAGCYGAGAVERIRRETIVPSNDVRVELQLWDPWPNTGTGQFLEEESILRQA